MNFFKKSQKQKGSITLEYILISTFAAIATISSLVYISKMFKGQLKKLSSKVKVESKKIEF